MMLGRDALGSFANTSQREWLVTNGIGGFASSTVSLNNTRRYHGLLFASLRPPVERIAMVSKLEVTANYGEHSVALATNEYADGTIAPLGYCRLESFHLDGLIPVWRWLLGDVRIEQRIWMTHGANTTYVSFERIGGSKPLSIELQPLCTYRDYHSQQRGARDFRIGTITDGIELIAFDQAQPLRITGDDLRFTIAPQWNWNFKHAAETERGLDDLEDLFRPAILTFGLPAGMTRTVVLSAERTAPAPAAKALAGERMRQQGIIACLGESMRGGPASGESVSDDVPVERLALAADQFIVERRDGDGKTLGLTVIAGYPWFCDWGRDTMIALPGLTLATGRADIARSVLQTFGHFVSRGMLPNRFADAGETPEYNTADASLWFFVAVHHYLRHTNDREFRSWIYPILDDMLQWHIRGTRFGIQMDPEDSLLRAGEAGVQLTWMDAKVGDWIVTPRIGKPVEINALWFNAVCILRDLSAPLAAPEVTSRYAALAAEIEKNFRSRFWNASGGYLFDVIDGPEHDDASLRPNQIFALSLPYVLIYDEAARRIVDICARELWTPVGLRSLAASDSRYVAQYQGAPLQRDGAYHQGTVWSWLLGPFATAHYRAYDDAPAALEFLRGVGAHLREACIGQVSEIMDGQAPFVPRGCIAQAWGVAEILRAWREISGARS
jgi:predicted glycogen debranching enzyme